MKYYLVILFFISALNGINAQNSEKAIEYNDFIVNEQNLVGRATDAFSKVCGAGQSVIMAKKHQELINQIESSLLKIKAVKAFNGNLELKTAAVSLFEFYQSTAKNEYVQMMALFNEGPEKPGNKSKLNLLMSNLEKRSLPVNNQFLDAQKKFAEQNGFKLNENQFEKELKEKPGTEKGGNSPK